MVIKSEVIIKATSEILKAEVSALPQKVNPNEKIDLKKVHELAPNTPLNKSDHSKVVANDVLSDNR